jgi:hypothetical protein
VQNANAKVLVRSLIMQIQLSMLVTYIFENNSLSSGFASF